MEFRIIYESATETPTTLEAPITLDCIEQITLSPWAEFNQVESIKKELRAKFPNCSHIPIKHTKLIDYREWKNYANRAVCK